MEHRIANIKVSELGLAFVIDADANLRVYDLWRNEKVARIQSCNNFALLENRGKRWIPTSSVEPSVCIYTNNGTTFFTQISQPLFPAIGQASAPATFSNPSPKGRKSPPSCRIPGNAGVQTCTSSATSSSCWRSSRDCKTPTRRDTSARRSKTCSPIYNSRSCMIGTSKFRISE